MIVLQVDLRVKEGAAPALEKAFREVFRPAISAQEGFVDVELLKSRTEADRYCLVIKFASEPLRLKWVASDLHQQVWPALAGHCAGFEAEGFDVV
jgi:heme-degrading monooxygenase HmoA